MQTIERHKNTTWRLTFHLFQIDEYREPLSPQPPNAAAELAASTFKATLKADFNGSALWTANPSDITVLDAAAGTVEVVVPKTATASLNPSNIAAGVEYLIDLQVTTSTGFVDTPNVIQVNVLPTVST